MGEASKKSMTKVLRLHGDNGPLRNERKSKHLRDGIFEFKTAQGDRILWFYGSNQTTILTHGFKKKRNYNDEIQRARYYRDLSEEIINDGTNQ